MVPSPAAGSGSFAAGDALSGMSGLAGGFRVSDAHVVGFDELADADLVVDRVYKGGSFGTPVMTRWPGSCRGSEIRAASGPLAATARTRSDSWCCTPRAPNRTGPTPWTPIRGRSPISGITAHRAGRCTTPPGKG